MTDRCQVEWGLEDEDQVVLHVKLWIPVPEFLAKARVIAEVCKPLRRVNPAPPVIETTTKEDLK